MHSIKKKTQQWGNQVQGSPGQLPCDPLLLTLLFITLSQDWEGKLLGSDHHNRQTQANSNLVQAKNQMALQ